MIPYPLYTNYKEEPDLANLKDSLINWYSYSPGNKKESLEKAFEVFKILYNSNASVQDRELAMTVLLSAIQSTLLNDDTLTVGYIKDLCKGLPEDVTNTIKDRYQYMNSCARVTENHNILSKRFSIDKIIAKYTEDPEDTLYIGPLVYKIAKLIDTYHMTIPAKTALVIEELSYIGSKFGRWNDNSIIVTDTMLYYAYLAKESDIYQRIVDKIRESLYLKHDFGDMEYLDREIDTPYDKLLRYIKDGSIYTANGMIKFTEDMCKYKGEWKEHSLFALLDTITYYFIFKPNIETNDTVKITPLNLLVTYITYNFTVSKIDMISWYIGNLKQYQYLLERNLESEDRVVCVIKAVRKVVDTLEEIRSSRGIKLKSKDLTLDEKNIVAGLESCLESVMDSSYYNTEKYLQGYIFPTCRQKIERALHENYIPAVNEIVNQLGLLYFTEQKDLIIEEFKREKNLVDHIAKTYQSQTVTEAQRLYSDILHRFTTWESESDRLKELLEE